MKTIFRSGELTEEVLLLKTQKKKIVLVPTMGNIHEGHIDLVKAGRSLGSNWIVIVSIFVNPLQFVEEGSESDFETYPRTFEEDHLKLSSAGCDLLFFPKNVSEIYEVNPVPTSINVGRIGKILEGEYRPGFFEGVATVVSILFNLSYPDAAIFGQKDWQQLEVIKQVVRDLRFRTNIIGIPTRREGNGLALSSRNVFLTEEEKTNAVVLYKVLKGIEIELKVGNRKYSELEENGMKKLQSTGFTPQYISIRKPNLHKISSEDPINDELVVLGAAFLGSTRLIDNVFLKIT